MQSKNRTVLPYRFWKDVLLMGVVLLAHLYVKPAYAQISADYDLSWSTVDAGGSIAYGGEYTLGSSIGQPETPTSNPAAPFSEIYFYVGFLQDSSVFTLPVSLSRFTLE